jgi:hypothetical protein
MTSNGDDFAARVAEIFTPQVLPDHKHMQRHRPMRP